MKRVTLALAAAIMALGGAGATTAALAQDGGPGPMDRGQPMSWADFKAHAQEIFARLDTNHDGVIDQAERQAMRDQMRARMGRDGDGPPPAPGAMGGDLGDHGDHMGGPGGGRRGGGMGAMMMLLRGADANHDGRITQAEFDASVRAHFDAMDTNHDGMISREERQAERERMRAAMQERMRDRGQDHGDMGEMHHAPDHGDSGDDMPPPAN